ncbi:MAG TPA: YggT family protein [Candidatus Dormibacteraeota bacterium]|nr:YggT family protein [Candidatus Dormibacteraeota bacterium]
MIISFIASALEIVLYAVIILILVRVVFSWVAPGARNTISQVAYNLTEPILAPVRRLIPPMAGLDLSPLVVTLAAGFIITFLREIAAAP